MRTDGDHGLSEGTMEEGVLFEEKIDAVGTVVMVAMAGTSDHFTVEGLIALAATGLTERLDLNMSVTADTEDIPVAAQDNSADEQKAQYSNHMFS